ncbi:hypothetical protein [Okeania sp. KiyG1]|uniref:hypothetical protein n=1 Tax=Okeania sp. KiyG1 TaxID=2720165 RepID=UPI0019248536|nr:hypothetical protein [Okeania sp. KiyG1]
MQRTPELALIYSGSALWLHIKKHDRPRSFLNLVTKLQCQGVEAAEGVFIASFKKHSGQKPDDTGVVKPINYYSIEWTWRKRTKEDNSIEQLCATLNDSGKFVDPQSTGKMQCLDGLSAPDLQHIISVRQQDKLLAGTDF